MEIDPSGSTGAWTAALLVCLCVCTLFRTAHVCVVSLGDARTKAAAEAGDSKAKTIVRITSAPSHFMACSQAATTLLNMFATLCAARLIAGAILRWELTGAAAWGAAAGLFVLFALVVLILGRPIPHSIALRSGEHGAYALLPVLMLVYYLVYPAAALLDFLTAKAGGSPGSPTAQEAENAAEEEIRMMVDAGNEKGFFEETEKDMINNIFEFDDKTAGDVMTHRTEMTAVSLKETVRQVIRVATQQGYSRIPAYDEDIDDVAGIVYVKDLLIVAEQPEALERPIRNFVRPAIFVPESIPCADLLKTFQDQKVQMAIVADEYGGTSGLVTMEDLMEAIVGNIQDEYDDEKEEVSQVSDTVFTLDGTISLDEVERILDISIPRADEFDTLSALLIDALDRIPEPGEKPSVRICGVLFTVMEVEEQLITLVRAELSAKPEQAEKGS